MRNAILFILTFSLAQIAFAQDWPQHLVSENVDGARCVDVADFNGDGRQDFVIGQARESYDGVNYEWDSGNLRIFLSDSDFGVYWDSQPVLSDTEFFAHQVSAVDFDDDGDMDIVAGQSTGVMAWWENVDNGAAWVRHDAVRGVGAFTVVDVDGDGDLDVAGDHYWIERVGDELPTWHEIAPGGDGTVADFDGDGDVDFLIDPSGGDTPLAIYENVAGDGSAWAAVTVYPDSEASKRLLHGDLDGDGDIDLIQTTVPGGGFYWYENTGLGHPWTQHPLDPSLDDVDLLVDFDSDGDLDMICAGSITTIWAENTDGSGLNWSTHSQDHEYGWYASDYAVGDPDGDGEPDIFMTTYVWYGWTEYWGTASWWENPATLDVDESGANEHAASAMPEAFDVSHAYPNPFNPSTSVRVSLPQAARLKVAVFDILGREVAVLADEVRRAGVHTLSLSGTRLTSGMYFLRVQAGDEMHHVQKLMLAK